MPKICIFPRVEGTGGVASFRLKFEAGLKSRGFEVTNDPDEAQEIILVLAGTRNLLPLWKAKRRGVKIVQRLDGINWVQRVRWAGMRYTVRAEYGNAMLSFWRSSALALPTVSSTRVSSFANGGRTGTGLQKRPPRSSLTA